MSNTIVRTNVMSLNSHRNLGLVGNQQSRASQRLSSGFRINSAADDAAGLGISEKMRAQIRGLDQASRNGQDGISLIQTAEGAMSTINEMVVRIRELVVQAANDTNAHDPENLATWSQSDRTRIQAEINQLMDEIDATRNRVEFNTRTLIDGSLGSGAVTGPGGPGPGAAPDADFSLGNVLNLNTWLNLVPGTGISNIDHNNFLATSQGGSIFNLNPTGGDGLLDLVTFGADMTALDPNFRWRNLTATMTTALNNAIAATINEAIANTVGYEGALTTQGVPAQTTGSAFQEAVVGWLTGHGAYNASDMHSLNQLFDPASDADGTPEAIAARNELVNAIQAALSEFDMSAFVEQVPSVDTTFGSAWNFSGSTLVSGAATAVTGNTFAVMDPRYFTDMLAAEVALNQALVNFAMDRAPATAWTTNPGVFESGDFVTWLTTPAGAGLVAGTGTQPGTLNALFEAAFGEDGQTTAQAGSLVGGAADTSWTQAGIDFMRDFVAALEDAISPFLRDTTGPTGPTTGEGNALWFQVGANRDQGVHLSIEDVGVDSLSYIGTRSGEVLSGFSFADLRTGDITHAYSELGVMRASGEEIQQFLTAIDFALSHVTEQRSNLGAMQNRLEFTIENLDIASENLSAAESRIRDADMAREMMRLTQANVLQQAAISMLAQANQAPQSVLQLLG